MEKSHDYSHKKIIMYESKEACCFLATIFWKDMRFLKITTGEMFGLMHYFFP